MKKLSTEIAAEIVTRLEAPEVRDALEATLKAAESESGTFEVVISTENLDRYQEVIKLEGWELDHYRKNPVVLWGHDYKLLPIGGATSVEISDGKLIAKGKFASHELAQEIRRLYDAGIVRATSVGFIPKEMEGNLITKAELLEFSFVSVPANPYALALALEKGASVNELVTKGFMHIEKDAEDDEPETEEDEESPADPEPAEKKYSRKAVDPIIASLKAAISALEALDTEEPERTEDEPVAETEEEKHMRVFLENRRTLQGIATNVGDILADMRHIVEART